MLPGPEEKVQIENPEESEEGAVQKLVSEDDSEPLNYRTTEGSWNLYLRS